MIKKPRLILKLSYDSGIIFSNENIKIIIDYFDNYFYIGSFTRYEKINMHFKKYNSLKMPKNPPINFYENQDD